MTTPSTSAETPQQPELTPDDRHRIETEVIRITGGYTKESSDTYLSCFKAAEYATLHERTAAKTLIEKVTETMKYSQIERIKELEMALAAVIGQTANEHVSEYMDQVIIEATEILNKP